MRKDIIIGAASLILVLAALTSYALFHPTSVKVSAPILPSGAYTEHSPSYDIAANYATSTPLSEGANATAMALMQQFVSDSIVQFKEGFSPAELASGQKQTFQIKYLIASSGQTISYIYTTYLNTLGVHGNLFFHTFTFDTTTGKALALGDIFMPGTSYLNTLSSIAREKLPSIIGPGADTGFIERGTAPDDKNFSNFFFDNQDFVILFAPYAVAPGAAGPQTLRIPISSISSILKLEYRVP